MSKMRKNTSKVQKSKSTMESPIQPSSAGQTVENFAPFKPLGSIDTTTPMTSLESLEFRSNMKRKRENESVMQESPVQNSGEILSDKLKTSNTTIQTTKSSKTSEVESISKEKVLKPWWTPSCLEISKKLSSVTKTDLSGLWPTAWFLRIFFKN